jgi:hypothetical protein
MEANFFFLQSHNIGTDCTEEFLAIHSQHAMQRLQPYMIGELVLEEEAEKSAENRQFNKCPSLNVSFAPEHEREHHDLKLCKR